MTAIATPFAIDRTAPGLATWLIGAAILVTFMGSYVLFRDWERFGPLFLRHPWLLGIDAAFGALLLITATPESTLAYVTVCTPLLAGLVYGWRGAAVFAALQTLIIFGVYGTDSQLEASEATALLLPGFCVIMRRSRRHPAQPAASLRHGESGPHRDPRTAGRKRGRRR